MQNKFAWIMTPDLPWDDRKEMITTALESGISYVLDFEYSGAFSLIDLFIHFFYKYTSYFTTNYSSYNTTYYICRKMNKEIHSTKRN